MMRGTVGIRTLILLASLAVPMMLGLPRGASAASSSWIVHRLPAPDTAGWPFDAEARLVPPSFGLLRGR